MGLISFLKNSDGRKSLKDLDKMANKVEELEPVYQKMSDAELQAQTQVFRDRLKKGETLDDILYDAFAALREASMRVLGMKHFHVQIMGGICLYQGRIAEMKTGEGKTLVATLPAYLEALAGKGVHIVTVNDYLAKRDADWMGKIHKFMGLTVGVVVPGMDDNEKRKAYAADITYGTNNEFGFDYLRDNLKYRYEDMVQRPLNFAIVDEVDSILIDEARTPLIISQRGEKSSDLYVRTDEFVKKLTGGYDDEFEEEDKKLAAEKKKQKKGERGESKIKAAEELKWDFVIERKEKQVHLTEYGASKAEEFFGISGWDGVEEAQINHHIQQALRARYLFKANEEYIVKDGEIVIVDEFTGRLMIGRRYSDGLHQAIEAKEGVKVLEENKTAATITFQNYFRLYRKLSGMTGTAKTEEGEFRTIYSLDVVEIPTNKPVARVDRNDQVYSTYDHKKAAIVREILERHAKGQPILVGTVSVEKSQEIANLIDRNGIKEYNLLNAVNHEREAEVVAQAGRFGAVTIATNMAGRGTDILLGGNPDYLAREELRKLVAKDLLAEDLARREEIKERRKEEKKKKRRTPEEVEEEKALREQEEREEKDREKARSAIIAAAIDRATGFAETDDPETLRLRALYRSFYEKYKKITDAEKQKVIEAGGLLIIGTERHESRRIDNQLRGRSGRQGDVGESIFFISLEDDLMKRFGGERMKGIYEKSKELKSGESLDSKLLTRLIEYAQKQIEGKNFSIRKTVLQYDDVMNTQRTLIYAERNKVLKESYERSHATEGAADAPKTETIHEQVKKYIRGFLEEEVVRHTVDNDDQPEKWSEDDLNKALEAGFLPDGTNFVTRKKLEGWEYEEAIEAIVAKVTEAYEEKIKRIQEEDPELNFEDFERVVLLRFVTNEWIDHIDSMDQLRKSIGLRSYAQIDPVMEYKKEGFAMFDEMVERIQNHTIETLLRADDDYARRQLGMRRRYMPTVLVEASDRIIPMAEEGNAEYQNGFSLGPVPVMSPVEGIVSRSEGAKRSSAPQSASAKAGIGAIPKEVDQRMLTNIGAGKQANAPIRKEKMPGPNEPCWCGSGKKYKKCHMFSDEAGDRK